MMPVIRQQYYIHQAPQLRDTLRQIELPPSVAKQQRDSSPQIYITTVPVLMSGLLRNHCLAWLGSLGEDSFRIPSSCGRVMGGGGLVLVAVLRLMACV
jgi:hypothetical protein